MLDPTGIEDSKVSSHNGYRLAASPNPFTPVVRITYRIPQPGSVVLTVYDISGHHVATLVNNHHEAGEFVTKWNARDHSGSKVSSGVYFLRIAAGRFTSSRKLVLLR
jgi:hypothetical protein